MIERLFVKFRIIPSPNIYLGDNPKLTKLWNLGQISLGHPVQLPFSFLLGILCQVVFALQQRVLQLHEFLLKAKGRASQQPNVA